MKRPCYVLRKGRELRVTWNTQFLKLPKKRNGRFSNEINTLMVNYAEA